MKQQFVILKYIQETIKSQLILFWETNNHKHENPLNPKRVNANALKIFEKVIRATDKTYTELWCSGWPGRR